MILYKFLKKHFNSENDLLPNNTLIENEVYQYVIYNNNTIAVYRIHHYDNTYNNNNLELCYMVDFNHIYTAKELKVRLTCSGLVDNFIIDLLENNKTVIKDNIDNVIVKKNNQNFINYYYVDNCLTFNGYRFLNFNYKYCYRSTYLKSDFSKLNNLINKDCNIFNNNDIFIKGNHIVFYNHAYSLTKLKIYNNNLIEENHGVILTNIPNDFLINMNKKENTININSLVNVVKYDKYFPSIDLSLTYEVTNIFTMRSKKLVELKNNNIFYTTDIKNLKLIEEKDEDNKKNN